MVILALKDTRVCVDPQATKEVKEAGALLDQLDLRATKYVYMHRRNIYKVTLKYP